MWYPRSTTADGKRLLVTRALRGLADGAVSVLLPSYLIAIGFSSLRVSAIVFGTLIGSAALLWHAHERVCFSLVPPTLSGLVSPYGDCPVGSITIPVTGQMIHLWVVPGVPTRWRNLDGKWLSRYLASLKPRR